MKICILILLIFSLFLPFAYCEYWDTDEQRMVVCCDDRPGCQVLQTVMMGSFADFDPEDRLNLRVFSAVLPRLTAVTEDDFTHFSKYFSVEKEVIKELYFIALANCLRSDLMVTPLADDMNQQNARTVLSLFLNPTGENAQQQIDAIVLNLTEEDIEVISKYASVPVDFVRYLFFKS